LSLLVMHLDDETRAERNETLARSSIPAALDRLAVDREHMSEPRRSFGWTWRYLLREIFATVPNVADAASGLLKDAFGRDRKPRRPVYGVASLSLRDTSGD
jgi:hypothetical protein